MKEKIFQLLKNKYAHLGLGDDVLMLQAATLDGMGIVTEDNIETVTAAQKAFLEGLQKQTDKRVTESIKKTTDDLSKKHEEELKKKDEEYAKKRDDETKKRKEDDERKDAEDAERKRREEAGKDIDAVRKLLDEMRNEFTQSKADYEAKIADLNNTTRSEREDLLNQIKALTESSKQISEGYEALKKEREEAKANEAKAARAKMIYDKAVSLGIPKSRIDEGFVIAEDADETTINSYLSTVATNAKAAQLPNRNVFPPDKGSEPSKEEIDAIVSSMVH